METIKVIAVTEDTVNPDGGKRVTLEREDGKTFTVNIHDDCWGSDVIYGLNLVFNYDGYGDHYL